MGAIWFLGLPIGAGIGTALAIGPLLGALAGAVTLAGAALWVHWNVRRIDINRYVAESDLSNGYHIRLVDLLAQSKSPRTEWRWAWYWRWMDESEFRMFAMEEIPFAATSMEDFSSDRAGARATFVGTTRTQETMTQLRVPFARSWDVRLPVVTRYVDRCFVDEFFATGR